MSKQIPAIEYFIIGWSLFIIGALVDFFIWLANPLWLFSIVLFIAKSKWARFTSIIAACISLSFRLKSEILKNENGGTYKIISFDSGYILWALSLAILAIGINMYFYLEDDKD